MSDTLKVGDRVFYRGWYGAKPATVREVQTYSPGRGCSLQFDEPYPTTGPVAAPTHYSETVWIIGRACADGVVILRNEKETK